jgi:hypothetical protein
MHAGGLLQFKDVKARPGDAMLEIEPIATGSVLLLDPAEKSCLSAFEFADQDFGHEGI